LIFFSFSIHEWIVLQRSSGRRLAKGGVCKIARKSNERLEIPALPKLNCL
jgi:hypothetical protein